MEIDFIGGSYKGYSSVVNAQRCVNFLPVLDKEGGKQLSLQGTPGLKGWANNVTDYDLTTFTEQDADNRLSETATTLTVTSVEVDDTAYLYKDLTATAFDGDFTLNFDLNCSAADNLGEFYPLLLANALSTVYAHKAANRDYLAVRLLMSSSILSLTLFERNGSSQYNSSSITISLVTAYYISVKRDETVGTYGTLYLYVYSDSARSTLIGSASITLSEKADFVYLYAGCSSGDMGAPTLSGTFSNYSKNTIAVVRGLSAEVSSKIYAAIGGDILEITTAGVITDKGNLDTTTGPVYFCDNGAKVMFVDGTSGYTVISSTFAKITDAQFPAAPTSCAYQDGKFLVSEGSTDNWHISYGTDDPTAWDDTYESAEGWRDNLTRIMSDGRQVWLFGDESFEVWYNAGTSPSPFARIEGTTKKVGVGARASVAEVQGTFFWFTNNRRAVMTQGYMPLFISTPQIEYLWDNYATISDAVGFARVQEGHILYTLTFPTQNITWEFDSLTGVWHELESSANNRWRANCYTYFNGKHYAGDFAISKIYEIDTDTYTDNGLVLKRIRTAQELDYQGKMAFFGGIEITGETGVGNATAPGDDPQMTLDWSDDGGRTWATSVSVDWGANTLYSTRAYFRRLGSARKRIFRITFEDQVKAVITGARLVPPPVIGNY